MVQFSGVIHPQIASNETGKPEQSTTIGMTFSLYAEQEGGAPLWVETQNVQLDGQGRYNVLLGATQAEGLPLDLFITGKARWLGVQPQLPGEGEQPRVLLVGVPYALKTADADTLGGLPATAFVQSGQGTVGATVAAGVTSATGVASGISPAVAGLTASGTGPTRQRSPAALCGLHAG
jgi:hypothetical protein